jgi:serine/threonine-protein kinase
LDRAGHEQPIPAKPRAYEFPRLSPDGKRIAVTSADEEHDIWVFDPEKETLTRISSGPAYEYTPVWTPDGRYLFFGSGPTPSAPSVRFDVQGRAADGTGTTQAWTDHQQGGYPLSITPDGKSLILYGRSREGAIGGLHVLPLDPKGTPRPLLPGGVGLNADVSPDGRWIAYDSSESGQYEVYVRPFPAVDSGRWQVSTAGGMRPFWSRSGRELFFLSANRMFVAEVRPGAAFDYSKPLPLFDFGMAYQLGGAPFRQFDISPDGKRFVLVKNLETGATSAHSSIVVVQSWFRELKSRMPARP